MAKTKKLSKNFSNRDFAKKFDEIAGKFDLISNRYTLARRCKEALEYVHGKCLEVGAGTGNVFSYLKNEGKKGKKDYILSDISLSMCRAAVQKHNASAVCCDAERLPFAGETFDAIISMEVIYYLQNPENFIKESRRLLRKNGKLVIIMANQDMKIYDQTRGFLRKMGVGRMYFDDGITQFMKLAKLQGILEKNGFRITSKKKIVIFPSRMLHGLNLLIEKTFLDYFCAFVLVAAEKKRL